jgi:hypothetical protein
MSLRQSRALFFYTLMSEAISREAFSNSEPGLASKEIRSDDRPELHEILSKCSWSRSRQSLM